MTYHLKRDAFRTTLKRYFVTQALSLFLPLIILMGLFQTLPEMSFLTYWLLIAILLYQLVRQSVDFRRMKADWNTFEIRIDEASITKSQRGHIDLSIPFVAIGKVLEIPQSGMSIQTHDAQSYIFVPCALEDYDSFRKKLLSIHPIEASVSASSNLNNGYTQLMLTKKNHVENLEKVVIQKIWSTFKWIVLSSIALIIILLVVFILV